MTKKSADINYISKDLFPKTYNRTMIDDDYIKQLEQENKRLNGAIQTYDILLKSNVEANKQLKLINKEHQQINGELRQANKLLNEQYIRLYKQYSQVKKDIRNVISLLDKNCDDLEGTEDEFDSLDKYQNIGHQEYME